MQKKIDYKVMQMSDLLKIDEDTYDFEETEFVNCRFSDLSGKRFSKCLFTSCDLSNALVKGTSFQDVKFMNCKMIGIEFFEVNPFGLCVEFDNSILNYMNFDGQKMNKSVFRNCKMQWANFFETDLSKTKIENCDFTYASFVSTDLRGVDFTTNYNFEIDPTANKLKKAKFKSSNLAGLLRFFDLEIED